MTTERVLGYVASIVTDGEGVAHVTFTDRPTTGRPLPWQLRSRVARLDALDALLALFGGRENLPLHAPAWPVAFTIENGAVIEVAPGIMH